MNGCFQFFWNIYLLTKHLNETSFFSWGVQQEWKRTIWNDVIQENTFPIQNPFHNFLQHLRSVLSVSSQRRWRIDAIVYQHKSHHHVQSLIPRLHPAQRKSATRCHFHTRGDENIVHYEVTAKQNLLNHFDSYWKKITLLEESECLWSLLSDSFWGRKYPCSATLLIIWQIRTCMEIVLMNVLVK